MLKRVAENVDSSMGFAGTKSRMASEDIWERRCSKYAMNSADNLIFTPPSIS